MHPTGTIPSSMARRGARQLILALWRRACFRHGVAVTRGTAPLSGATGGLPRHYELMGPSPWDNASMISWRRVEAARTADSRAIR